MHYSPWSLPLGRPDFKELIEKNFIYVDKTKYIYELVTSGGYYFLSRPRRFGKSLLLSILKQIFLGNKDLFKPFFIQSSDYEWQEYPVINLDFAQMTSIKTGELEREITWKLEKIAKQYGIDIDNDALFGDLIQKLSLKNKVVLLVDDYDYPMINSFKDTKLAEEHRTILRDLFDVVEANSSSIHFIFIVGIIQFSKTSIFSGLNNLIDLSFSDKVAQIIGFTEIEIIYNFKLYIERVYRTQNILSEEVLKNLQVWYDGYLFAKPNNEDLENLTVYNPVPTLLYLETKKLKSYWFPAGTPTFLMPILVA